MSRHYLSTTALALVLGIGLAGPGSAQDGQVPFCSLDEAERQFPCKGANNEVVQDEEALMTAGGGVPDQSQIDEANAGEAAAEVQAETEAEGGAEAPAEADLKAQLEAEEQARQEAEQQPQQDAEAAPEAVEDAPQDIEDPAQAQEGGDPQADLKAQLEAEEQARQQAGEQPAEGESAEDAPADVQPEPVTQAAPDADVQAEPDDESQAQQDNGAPAEDNAEITTEQDTGADAQPEAGAEAAGEMDAQQKAEQEADLKSRLEAEENAQQKTGEQTQQDATDQPTAEAEGDVDAEAGETGDQAQQQTDDQPAAEAEGEADTEAQADQDGADQTQQDADAEADAEIDKQTRQDAEAEAQEEAERAARRAERRAERETAAAAAAEDDADAEVETETVSEEDVRTADEEFDTSVAATGETAAVRSDDDDDGMSKFEKALLLGLGAAVVGTVLSNGDEVVSNSGDRVVVRRDGELAVLKNDDALLRRPGSDVGTQSFSDGSTRTTVSNPDGSRIVTIRDADGSVLRRSRILASGEEYLLFDDTRQVEPVSVADLPRIDTRRTAFAASPGNEDALRQALNAELRGEIGRNFSLEQVRSIRQVRELAPQVEVEAITFATGSAAISPDKARELAELGTAISDLIRRQPGTVILVEGHTDAVGDDSYNLALSDRRAETVALALTQYFDVPPENMVTQGYGERYLKVQTQTAEPANRRAVVRNITQLVQ